MYFVWGNGGSAPPPGSIGAVPPAVFRVIRWALLGLVAIGVIVLLNVIKTVYTDWLWFDHLGYRSVYTTVLSARIWLFFAGAVTFAALLGVNLYLAHRFSRGESILPLPRDIRQLLQVGMSLGVGTTVFLSSLIFGLVVSNRWDTFLKLINATPFGESDPLFAKDISFYVSTLPVLNFIQGWFLGAVITVILASLLMYMVNFSLRGTSFLPHRRILGHFAALGAALMVVTAANHLLDIYELVYSSRGAAFGAGYADVHARLPALRLLTAVALVSAILFVGSIFTGGLRLMLGALGLWVVSAIVVGAIFPALFQRFVVNPNELAREEQFIARNISATRRAYNLDRIQEVQYQVSPGITPEVVANNPQTINNIRLWDHRPLLDVYNQQQFLRLYYRFFDVDVDRYMVNGEYRQVMLSARELDPDNLPADAQRWINRKLQYTHGYGAVVSPVTEFTADGKPVFLLKDIPPTATSDGLALERPEVYYGENTKDYVIVNSMTEELDHHPPEGQPVYSRYQGEGGVALSSFLRRLAYAWQMGDLNILISGQITPDSRIQYRRTIQDRIRTIAPFLLLDPDPYLVIADGRLWWMQDAYTVVDTYPYSTPTGGINYIRNSVKIVMDPYDGKVNFYVFDPNDPVLRIYQEAFPGLFRPKEEMPPSLRSHVRYPEQLFLVQSRLYLNYHMTDPRVFFNREDQWAIPQETFFGKSQTVEPYYLIMRLPGEPEEEFVLILPFTPANRPNLVAWLAARSDDPHYGEVKAYLFPKGSQVDGPSQVEARIDNDTFISQQFTLWGQAGSEVIRGHLLVIPIEDTVIYVEPIFLQAEGFKFPELKQVIIATSNKVVMRPTLQEGLLALLGQAPPTLPPGGIASGEVQRQIEEISRALEELRRGLISLEEALNRLKQIIGGTTQ